MQTFELAGREVRWVEFEWHERKAQLVEDSRDIPFEVAARVFRDPARLDDMDDRQDYGEIRRIAIGKVDRKIITVVYTMRNDICRIITAWRASRKERRRYEAV